MYVTSTTYRNALLQRHITLKNQQINMYDQNPYDKSYNSNNSPQTVSEIVTFKGLMPMDDPENKQIIEFLNNHGNLKLRSDVIKSKSRRANNTMTQFYNGNRHVYIEEGFNPLPRQAKIGNKIVYISHKSQVKKCNRCKEEGHLSRDKEQCPAYTDKNDTIVIVKN